MTLANRRVGLFGGAFDPPHSAHRALIEAALTALRLDSLLVLPTGQPWHKQRDVSPVAQRLAMAQLAFADMPQVQVDIREAQRPGATYTVDTLRELHAEQPGTGFFLIIGEDQAAAAAGRPNWPAAAWKAESIRCVRPTAIRNACRGPTPG